MLSCFLRGLGIPIIIAAISLGSVSARLRTISLAQALAFSPEVSVVLDRAGLEIRELSEAKLSAAIEIERASYPDDEAASPENMKFRRANAGPFFLEATRKRDVPGGEGGDMVGFICGTCSKSEELTHESMHGHDPEGRSLCIHSVAIAERFRRRGYSTALLKAYVERVALTQPRVRRVFLIAKAGLLGMYASCGFLVKGLSPVVHGKDPWFEMVMDLDATEPRRLGFVQVDAFSERVFGGNPAAVFFTHNGGDGDWMQKVAVEMNLSETCFVELQPSDGAEGEEAGPTYALRWFTPGGEVALCGHATLAAAHALWDERRVTADVPIRFSTASGVLACRRDEEGWICMDFPAEVVGEPLPREDEDRRAIVEALRLSGEGSSGRVLFVGRNRFDVMVEVAPEAFACLQPDMRLLSAIRSRGFIVTCSGIDTGASSPGSRDDDPPDDPSTSDFCSRFFAPALGIDEDPVTGSAHCCLGPYWAAKLGRESLVGYQASPRGGVVRIKVAQGEGSDRVLLAGKAATVLRGLFRR